MSTSLEGYRAVLFDLDGVVTDTASVHMAAWKTMFDEVLRARAADAGEEPVLFDEADYQRDVDGKPRYDGVRSFLRTRGIELPEGDISDPPDADTVHGLGNRKNDLVQELLADGVVVYPGTLRLVERLRARGVPLAIVSSSRNAGAVLAAAGIADLFDDRVDGEVAVAEGLPGKPAPDTFLAAAERLGVPAADAVVVEDAVSGVQAGRAGGFGLVVGVDREGDPRRLRDAGADVVVADLAELLEP